MNLLWHFHKLSPVWQRRQQWACKLSQEWNDKLTGEPFIVTLINCYLLANLQHSQLFSMWSPNFCRCLFAICFKMHQMVEWSCCFLDGISQFLKFNFSEYPEALINFNYYQLIKCHIYWIFCLWIVRNKIITDSTIKNVYSSLLFL